MRQHCVRGGHCREARGERAGEAESKSRLRTICRCLYRYCLKVPLVKISLMKLIVPVFSHSKAGLGGIMGVGHWSCLLRGLLSTIQRYRTPSTLNQCAGGSFRVKG